MNRPYLLRCEWPGLTVLLLILLVSGCGHDNPTTPNKPGPAVSMSLESTNGHIGLTVRNSGGPMSGPSNFVAAFADGQSDTLVLSLADNDSTTCLLSNVHGGVTVTNEEWHLEATTGDCLAEYFESLFASVDMGSLVPSPVAEVPFLLCTYEIYLNSFNSDQPTFQLIRTDNGLTLRTVYSNITWGFAAPSPGALCVDITGNIAISSVVVDTHIDIVEGDDPQVTLGSSEATINGFQVNVNGTFGFIVEWITDWFQGTFTSTMEDALVAAISSNVGSDLSGLVIVNTGCAE
ncbi:MAG: hypothetical protein NTW07_03410 [candidate division Zixibacteria bacterium]|nr:hypothetical protein [candidate division Zixibacteria bacterium]